MKNDISGLLKQLRDEHRRIGDAISVLENLDGATRHTGRRISAAGRRRIAAAQRARWAKVKGRKVISIDRKGRMSVAGRRRIAAAQRARWAKVRAAKKA